MTYPLLRRLIYTGSANLYVAAAQQIVVRQQIHSPVLHTCSGYSVNSVFLLDLTSYLCPDIHKALYPTQAVVGLKAKEGEGWWGWRMG